MSDFGWFPVKVGQDLTPGSPKAAGLQDLQESREASNRQPPRLLSWTPERSVTGEPDAENPHFLTSEQTTFHPEQPQSDRHRGVGGESCVMADL